MRIIKEGKIPSPTYTGTCKHCGTEYEYNKRDVRTDTPPAWSRDPRDYGWQYVFCPFCTTKNAHPNNSIDFIR